MDIEEIQVVVLNTLLWSAGIFHFVGLNDRSCPGLPFSMRLWPERRSTN